MKYRSCDLFLSCLALSFSLPIHASVVTPTGGSLFVAADTIIGYSDSKTVPVAVSYDDFGAATLNVGAIDIFAQATISGKFTPEGFSLFASADVQGIFAPVISASAQASAILGFDLDVAHRYSYVWNAETGALGGETNFRLMNSLGTVVLDLASYEYPPPGSSGEFFLAPGHYSLNFSARSGGPVMSQVWSASGSVNVTAVPLPPALWLLGSAWGGLLAYSLRSRRSRFPVHCSIRAEQFFPLGH